MSSLRRAFSGRLGKGPSPYSSDADFEARGEIFGHKLAVTALVVLHDVFPGEACFWVEGSADYEQTTIGPTQAPPHPFNASATLQYPPLPLGNSSFSVSSPLAITCTTRGFKRTSLPTDEWMTTLWSLFSQEMNEAITLDNTDDPWRHHAQCEINGHHGPCEAQYHACGMHRLEVERSRYGVLCWRGLG